MPDAYGDIEARLRRPLEVRPCQLSCGEKYEEVFGEPTRAGNKDFLFKRIAWRIQSLAEGDLSERARRRADALARDAAV